MANGNRAMGTSVRCHSNFEENNSDSDTEDDFIKQEEQPSNLENGELKEYQLEGLNWLLKLHSMNINGILADEMGLGKTIQTIALIGYLYLKNDSLTHLIIVPKVTIKNWEREINKWLPKIKLLFFYGDKDERKILSEHTIKESHYDIVLTTFECSMKEKTALSTLNYEYLIIDEAHRLKNDQAKFSMVVRKFNSRHRLLLTGTPFQNNLHELWSLLNFLMPNIFNDSEEFDRIFNLDTATEEGQMKIVKQIHQLLKPFVLRRLKSEIKYKIPPKKEIFLYVGLSELQKNMYKQILSKNIDVVNGVNKDRIQLLNILMQLKKVCNHPYLFPNVEQGPPYIEGEHLIYNSMKLKILDVLLKKIHSETNNKVLIFSQMTTLLNILDDYCRYRQFSYLRMDGQTSSEDRDKRIEEFQNPNSDKWLFLISTRAGGLGINLHAANIVILYDSDWNPQVDLQAIDRAHRIGQTKPVIIYRFVCEGTVEEKIVERAAKKLKLDHLIIQKGKKNENKATAVEMTTMLQYGADKIFSDKNENNEETTIEKILEYSINKTETVNNTVLKSIEEKLNVANLSLNTGNKDIYQFEGEDYKKKNELSNNFIKLSYAIGNREHKKIRDDVGNKIKTIKTRHRDGWKLLAGGGYIHQFFDANTLDYLDEKEKLWKEYLQKLEDKKNKENVDEENKSNNSNNDSSKEDKDDDESQIPEEFTEKDEKYREELLKEGFKTWTKKDFDRFLHAAEMVGLDEPEQISRLMKTKTPEEVEKYIKVFKKRIDDFPNGDRIMAKINKSENEKNKNNEYQSIIDEYYNLLIENEEDDLCDIFSKIKISYKEYKNKKNINNNKDLFNPEEDKYLLCLLIKYGYRNWNPIKYHILTDPFMKFNINMKMKTEQELLDRSNYIINCLKLEIKRAKEKKEQLLKEKEKLQKNAQKAKLRKVKKNGKIKNNSQQIDEDYKYDEEEDEKEIEKEKKKSKSKKHYSKKKKNGKKKK